MQVRDIESKSSHIHTALMVVQASLKSFRVLIMPVSFLLEYNILSTVEKTGKKFCCIREQIIDIVVASESDFFRQRDLRME